MASTKAVYIDTKNGKVVEGKEPEEGIVLIAENEDITDEVRQARIDRAKSDLVTLHREAEGGPVETAVAPEPDRTATTTTARGSKKK